MFTCRAVVPARARRVSFGIREKSSISSFWSFTALAQKECSDWRRIAARLSSKSKRKRRSLKEAPYHDRRSYR